MVKYSSTLDATFAALADPTRRALLARLARGACSVTELAAPFAVSLPAVSKHLRVLENAGLLARAKDGRVRRCGLVAGPMKVAADWIARYQRFWGGQFEALATYLDESKTREDSRWPHGTRAPRRGSPSRGPFPPPGRRSSGPGRTRKS